MTFRVSEPTLSPEVAGLLEGFLGCRIAREGVLQHRKQFDFFLELDESKLIVELKIGGIEKLPRAIAQAEEYRNTIGADGVIAIVYPEEARQDVTRAEDVRDIAVSLRPTVTVLCPFLREHYRQTSLAELSSKLKDSISKPVLAPSVGLVVEALRQSVQGVALEIKRSAGVEDPIIKETVGSLALFEMLSQESQQKVDDKAVKGIVADLAGYILVNQLLLHHILSKSLNLPKRLEHISAPIELNAYFKEVQDINYRAVYCIDIASHIPPTATREISIAITALRAIQPENLRHDLLGRIFHEFLPPETRKRLGAFYTRPQAAEILAGLAIDRSNQKVLDIACGSGTLLVAAYRKKMAAGKRRPHHKVVEDEITGVDVMPFAAHLAALNLTMQAPMEVTNKTRIGIGNSLHLVLGNQVSDVARWLRTFGNEATAVDIGEPFSKGEMFKIERADVVIMNPPFTRKESLTQDMKGLSSATIGDQNYWAYFIVQADSIVPENGRIAAVLPRDFFRGEYSRKVREYLFANGRYSLEYVVKLTKDWAFSENALFRDYLVVLQKTSIRKKCALVYVKKPLGEFTLSEATGIPNKVKLLEQGETFEDESLFVVWKDQAEISDRWQDLGHLVGFNTNQEEKLVDFYHKCLVVGSGKLVPLGNSRNPRVPIIRGFEHGGENLQSLLYIVRPLAPKRITRSKLVLVSECNGVTARLKGHSGTVEIPIQCLKRGFRTSAYVPAMDLHQYSDYVLVQPFSGFDEILGMFRIRALDFDIISKKARKRFAHLVLNRRFDLTAPGTKALAFFSEETVLPVGLHWSITLDSRTAQAMCLWFNSIFYLVELLLLHTETRGSYMLISEDQVRKVHVPDMSVCGIDGLLEAFDQVRYTEFPPLVEQFENPPEARWTIDQAVLRTMGFTDDEINELLPSIYKAMAIEMQSWQELMKQSPTKETEPSLQLHLLPQ